MPAGQPIQIQSLDYWRGQFGGLVKLQFHYSNGKSSPLIEATEPSITSKITLHFSDIKQIRRVIGTNESFIIRQFIFKKSDGSEVGRVQVDTNISLSDTEKVLDDGEVIVGFYGQCDNVIRALGVMVWKPPRE